MERGVNSSNPWVEIAQLAKDDVDYPSALDRYLDAQAPAALATLGQRDLLGQNALALFCSVKCPGTAILRAYDLVRALRDAGTPVIGGFQSPMERECLALLLRGSGPVIVCPARDIHGMRVPHEWRGPLAEGRLLVLAPFDEGRRRATTTRATARNLLVAALAAEVLIPYAAPGGKTEALARTVASWGKRLVTVESADNVNLTGIGAEAVGMAYKPGWE